MSCDVWKRGILVMQPNTDDRYAIVEYSFEEGVDEIMVFYMWEGLTARVVDGIIYKMMKGE